VNSVQALLAPSLIDNQMLERRVPESDLAGEMLVGISKLGLAGLAMLPTDLQPPGLSRPLLAVKDYRGTRIGVREGEVAKEPPPLGATPVGSPRRTAPRLDGAELDLSGLNWNEYDLQAKATPPQCQPVDARR
jgi:hypothetical protein